jgi:8-oxo-dGTP diphosphatase
LSNSSEGAGPPGGALGRAIGADRRQRVSVYGICEDGGGSVLLVRAARSLTVAGRWFLPGGGLQHGESPVEGLQREFAEETGLEVQAQTLRGVLSDMTTLPDGSLLHTIRIIYDVGRWVGELRAEASGSSDAVQWFRREEMGSLPTMPYVLEAVFGLGEVSDYPRH